MVFTFIQRAKISVCILNCYKLDDPRIESWWGQNFLHLFRVAFHLVPRLKEHHSYNSTLPPGLF